MRLKNICKLLQYGFILATVLVVYSCTSPQKKDSKENNFNSKSDPTQEYVSKSKNAQAFVPESPRDDPEYGEVLTKWERDVSLYKDFMMYFSGTATLMAPEMIDAYKQRVEKVLGVDAKLDKNIIPEDKNTISIVISMYTTFPKFDDLEDSKIWNCALFYNNRWIQPSNLVYYRNKSSFIPYFTMGTSWSRMYVAQFPISHFNLQRTLEDSDHPIVFSMHSGIAKADYYWRACGKSVGNCK